MNYFNSKAIFNGLSVILSFASGFSYVLGAVETFLKAVPAAGIFRGNHKSIIKRTAYFHHVLCIKCRPVTDSRGQWISISFLVCLLLQNEHILSVLYSKVNMV